MRRSAYGKAMCSCPLSESYPAVEVVLDRLRQMAHALHVPHLGLVVRRTADAASGPLVCIKIIAVDARRIATARWAIAPYPIHYCTMITATSLQSLGPWGPTAMTLT